MWKKIEEFEKYEINELGEVRSLSYKGTGEVKLMKPQKGKNGYMQVQFTVNGLRYRRLVHRLVAEAFIDNVDNKPEIDHIDGDRTNNHVSNLRWVSRHENNMNPIARKRESDAKNHKKKPVLCVETGVVYESVMDCSRKTTIPHTHISSVCRHKMKKAGGYHWQFI